MISSGAMTRMGLVPVLALLCCSLGLYAQQEIKIGVLYSLTGAEASTGVESKDAVELAADIINNGAKGVRGLPFSQGGGLPGLKGAKSS